MLADGSDGEGAKGEGDGEGEGEGEGAVETVSEDEDIKNVETENIVPVLPQVTLQLAPGVSATPLAAVDDVDG